MTRVPFLEALVGANADTIELANAWLSAYRQLKLLAEFPVPSRSLNKAELDVVRSSALSFAWRALRASSPRPFGTGEALGEAIVMHADRVTNRYVNRPRRLRPLLRLQDMVDELDAAELLHLGAAVTGVITGYEIDGREALLDSGLLDLRFDPLRRRDWSVVLEKRLAARNIEVSSDALRKRFSRLFAKVQLGAIAVGAVDAVLPQLRPAAEPIIPWLFSTSSDPRLRAVFLGKCPAPDPADEAEPTSRPVVACLEDCLTEALPDSEKAEEAGACIRAWVERELGLRVA